LICACVTATDTESAIAEMRAVARYADIIEIRLDYIHAPSVRAIAAEKPKPLIATNRPSREMGKFEGTEEERLALLREADLAGFDYVDVEYDSLRDFGRPRLARLIVSYHDFGETPADLDEIYKQLLQTDADVIKLVTFANALEDNLRIFRLLKSARKPTIAFCMGELGLISRVLSIKFGGFLTFGSLAEGRESAPGQITIRDMKELYRLDAVNADTEIYGVIANPVAHSMSPAIHNAAFAATGLNAVYLPFKVDDVVTFIRDFREIDVRGYSVTIPHKEAAIAAVDEVDSLVREIGALNTIVNRDGRLFGYNTDCVAAIRALEDRMGEGALKGKRVVLLGAGGSARAIAFGLKRKGVRLKILNRTVERGKRLAEEVGCEWGALDEIHSVEADVIINSTSVGMYPDVDRTPVPADVLKEGMVVFDIVYNPMRTRLLMEAEERGCLTVSGVDMFVNQAVAQFEMWTGRKAPVGLMRSVVEQRLQ